MPSKPKSGSGPRRRRSGGRCPYDVVVLTASSGGVSTLGGILADLPAGFPAPILVAQHRGSRQPEVLTAILALRSKLPTKLAEDGEPLQPGTVYIAPPQRALLVSPGPTVSLSGSRRGREQELTPMMESVGEVFGDRALAVLLTVGGGVPLEEARAIRERGGTTLLQHEGVVDASREPLPESAFDRVLPLERVAPTIIEMVGIARSSRRRRSRPSPSKESADS